MPDLRLRDQYQELIREFKPDSGHLLPCLHKIQHQFGYVPAEAVPAIARQLKLTPAAVFGALTFYTEFRTAPPPEVLIQWCSGPACRLKGGEQIRRALEATLEIGMEESTPDNRVGLHLQQCDGSCAYAPLVWLRRAGAHPDGPDAPLLADRGEIHGPLTVPQVIELARRLKAGELNV
ncbi:MAG: hypothetical protein C4290_06435 [Chloroflexota bacterium]